MNNSPGMVNAEQMANMLMSSPAMNMIMDRTKKMMWSMVEYKDLQMVYTCAIKEIETNPKNNNITKLKNNTKQYYKHFKYLKN